MEEQLIGYALNLLNAAEKAEVERSLQSHPEHGRFVQQLRVLLPLPAGGNSDQIPCDLALRTIGAVAEHLVLTQSKSKEKGECPIGDYIHSLSATKDQPLPATPTMRRIPRYAPVLALRNFITTSCLILAMLVIGITAIFAFRTAQEIQRCQNNLRTIHTAFVTFADTHDQKYPQLEPGTTVLDAWKMLGDNGCLPRNCPLTCVPSERVNTIYRSDGSPILTPASEIDYTYLMGYRDATGVLHGLAKQVEVDSFPMSSDAPERFDDRSIPKNHRRGHNVLFNDGSVKFCTSANVGPMVDGTADDIFFNSIHEVRAGTCINDIVLGKAGDQP